MTIYYLRRRRQAGLGAALLRSSVRPQHIGVPTLCNLKLKEFSFLIIETWHIDWVYIEDVNLLFFKRFLIPVWKTIFT